MMKKLRFFALLIGFTVLYVAAAKVGLMFAIVGSTVSLVWAPSGIALAAVLIYGWRMGLAVALGAFLANTGTGIPVLAACGIAAGNTLEALVGARLLLRFTRFKVRLQTRQDVLALLLCAAILSTLLSATVGVATLAGVGALAKEEYAAAWLKWWMGDMMGILVVAPPLLLWLRRPVRVPSPSKLAEALFLFSALVVVSLKIFGSPEMTASQHYAAPMAVFPFVIWGALRFQQPGASLVTLVFSLMAVWGASQGTGPFMPGNSLRDVMQWGIFSIVVATIGLLLAASVAEQRRAQEQIRRSHKELEGRVVERTRELVATHTDLSREMAERHNLELALIRVSEDERRTIGFDLHDGLGQHLTSLALLCSGLRQKLSDRAQPEVDIAARIGELINEAAAMNRAVTHGLYPVAFERGGLTAALEQLAADANVPGKLNCVFSAGPNVQVHDPLVAINLYRIAQEAIHNAVKYSQASLIRIDLARVDRQCRLTLRDDGIGIDSRHLGADSGIGMHSMQHRASLLGGILQVAANVPHGTVISVTYPDLKCRHEQQRSA